MRFRSCSFVAVLAVLAGACAAPAPPPPPQPDLVAEERAIRDADDRWLKAAQARDAAGEAAVIAPDGIVYRTNMDPAVGPDAFKALQEKTYAENPKVTVDWASDSITVAQSGDMAVESGTFKVSGLGPKADVSDTGKFLTVWKKVNGVWKVAFDMGSSTVPLPKK